MKPASFSATFILLFIAVARLKLLDNLWWIIGLFVFSLLTGALLNFLKPLKSLLLQHLRWGIFFGSLTSLGLLLILILWVYINYPQ